MHSMYYLAMWNGVVFQVRVHVHNNFQLKINIMDKDFLADLLVSENDHEI